MYNEALNSYAVITRNRNFANANQLKVNMGNIYVKLGDYPKAIKTYRMALDQIPNTYKHMRLEHTVSMTL
jgi:intraflagellar transport protein 88